MMSTIDVLPIVVRRWVTDETSASIIPWIVDLLRTTMLAFKADVWVCLLSSYIYTSTGVDDESMGSHCKFTTITNHIPITYKQGVKWPKPYWMKTSCNSLDKIYSSS